jgi:WD40 repeat protein
MVPLGFLLIWVPSVLRNLLAKEDRIYSVCFSHDGKYLATSSLDKMVYVSLSSQSCPHFTYLVLRSGK